MNNELLFTCINIEMHRFFGEKLLPHLSLYNWTQTKTNKLTYMETVKNNSDLKKKYFKCFKSSTLSSTLSFYILTCRLEHKVLHTCLYIGRLYRFSAFQDYVPSLTSPSF